MSNDDSLLPLNSAITERDGTGVEQKAYLRDARYHRFARLMFWRWWRGLTWEERDAVCTDLCPLPRGTASDEGWLVPV